MPYIIAVKLPETERLILRPVINSDAGFMLDLLNQPSFIKYIGDRNVRTIREAENYIENRFTQSFQDFGFGMYLIELKTEFAALPGHSKPRSPNSEIRTPIGICGFVKRDNLPDADLGFAFLPQFCGKGFALESATAAMQYGSQVLGFKRVLAITTQDNKSSQKLLGKIGFRFESLIKMPNNEELNLFSWEKI